MHVRLVSIKKPVLGRLIIFLLALYSIDGGKGAFLTENSWSKKNTHTQLTIHSLIEVGRVGIKRARWYWDLRIRLLIVFFK